MVLLGSSRRFRCSAGWRRTFNDIWGVTKGRSWFWSTVLYWAVITLAPVMIIVALGLAKKPHLQLTQGILDNLPPFLVSAVMYGGSAALHLLPTVFLCGSFALFYRLMPNTRVHWRAAIIGGLVGGLLWHLNNVVSVLYVSRWVTNSKIYGGLAAIPVTMVGLYFSWLILLFGAQVAYSWQNRRAYVQDKQAENINQRGREFIALRLMQCVGQRFLRGERPATVAEMADALVVPSRLVQQIMQTLLTAGLLVEVAGPESAYSPARALEGINCHHILMALRRGQGEELATRDDPARAEVFGEFEKILAAEQKAASSVTVLAMVNRTEELTALAGRRTEVLPEGRSLDGRWKRTLQVIIGVPKRNQAKDEYRVALLPSAAHQLVKRGHQVSWKPAPARVRVIRTPITRRPALRWCAITKQFSPTRA